MNRLTKFLLLIMLFSGCSMLRHTEDRYTFLWFHVKPFEKTFQYIPTTNIKNLIPLLPFETQSQQDREYNFSSFEDSIIHVDSFFMFAYEVSNIDYLHFLSDLKQKDSSFYIEMLPDQTVWRSKFAYNEPYTETYFRHYAYHHFPVVGVSYYQAEQYCKWLTVQYQRASDRKYQNAIFMLPTKSQWLVAALGRNHERFFSWDGYKMQDEDGKWLANFYRIEQIQISRDTGFFNCANSSRFYSDCLQISAGYYDRSSNRKDQEWRGIPAPVKSFQPNDYGLYNMCGNMEEYVREPGILKGGSWNDPGHYLQLDVEQQYDTTDKRSPYSFRSAETGFRIVMEVR